VAQDKGPEFKPSMEKKSITFQGHDPSGLRTTHLTNIPSPPSIATLQTKPPVVIDSWGTLKPFPRHSKGPHQNPSIGILTTTTLRNKFLFFISCLVRGNLL
jgi:hypothetical protein